MTIHKNMVSFGESTLKYGVKKVALGACRDIGVPPISTLPEIDFIAAKYEILRSKLTFLTALSSQCLIQCIFGSIHDRPFQVLTLQILNKRVTDPEAHKTRREDSIMRGIMVFRHDVFPI